MGDRTLAAGLLGVILCVFWLFSWSAIEDHARFMAVTEHMMRDAGHDVRPVSRTQTHPVEERAGARAVVGREGVNQEDGLLKTAIREAQGVVEELIEASWRLYRTVMQPKVRMLEDEHRQQREPSSSAS